MHKRANTYIQPFVRELEDIASQYHAQYLNNTFKKLIIHKIPRSVLLLPGDAESRLQGQSFKLGDRVLYALDAGPVPLATKGTVVGVQEKIVDVLFDTTFMGGQNLGGRCSDFRGLPLPQSCIINLSYPAFAQKPELSKRQQQH